MIYVIIERYYGRNNVIGIATDEKNRDEIIKQHYKRYGSDVGYVYWETWELNKYQGQLGVEE